MKEKDDCNFVNDTTLYVCGKDLDAISNKLELEINTAIKWFKDNEIVANPSKFQLAFLSKYKKIKNKMSFDGKTIKSSDTFNCLKLSETKILILNDIYKILVTKQIAKPKLFSV